MFRTEKAQIWKAILVALVAVALLGGTAGAAVETDGGSKIEPWGADYPYTYVSDEATIYAKTAEQIDLALWGIELYTENGFELPHVEAWMGNTSADCVDPNGNRVRGFATWRDGQAILFHCGDGFTMLHELAHVYDRHDVTEAERDEFLEHRHLDKWQDVGNWSASGEEHFANVLAWGLDQDSRRAFETYPNDDASLAEAFALIATASTN